MLRPSMLYRNRQRRVRYAREFTSDVPRSNFTSVLEKEETHFICGRSVCRARERISRRSRTRT